MSPAGTKDANIRVRQRGAKQTQNELGGVDKGLTSLGKSALIASAGFLSAAGLVAGMKASITAAGIQEQAEKKLEVALGGVNQALLDQASALQQQTTFGDEAIIGVQASIAAFIDDEEQIKAATAATLDFAAATGFELKSAGDLIAKTLGSSTNAMSRYGIQVEGAVGSTERLESLTADIARVFGGQATAQADTLTGSIEQMKNAVGDVAEGIGGLMAHAIIGAAKVVKLFAEDIGLVIEKVEELLGLTNEQEQVEREISDARLERMRKVGEFRRKQAEQIRNSIELRSEEAELIEDFAVDELEVFDAIAAGDKELTDISDKLTLQRIVNAIRERQALETLNPIINILTSSLEEAFNPDLKGPDVIKNTVIKLLTAMQAVVIASGGVNKALTEMFLTGIGLGAALIAFAALEAAKSGVWAIKFQGGGIVPGQGVNDTVPALLTPGELILNTTQQQNVAEQISGKSIVVNIEGDFIGTAENADRLASMIAERSGQGFNDIQVKA